MNDATRAKKKAADKSFIDPTILKSMEGQLSFTDADKAALERSKIPGVALGEREEAGKVFRIEIVGAHKTEADAVILRLLSKVGRPFSPALASEDVREIMKMGLFSDVEVLKLKTPSNAIALLYELKEIPTIFQIKTVGNEAFSSDELKESIAGLENYQVAKKSRLDEFAEKMRQFYVAKGYYLAKVEASIARTDDADIKRRESEGLDEKTTASFNEIDTARVNATDFHDVIFTVTENNKVRINRISFSGNNNVDSDILKSSLRSQENHLLSFVTDWGTFREEYLLYDSKIIEEILSQKGFLQARVLSSVWQLSPDKVSIDINFRIIENAQYKLGDVSVSGSLVEQSEVIYRLQKERDTEQAVFLASKLQNLIIQKKGEVFNKPLLIENVMAVAEKYRDEGYAYVNVSPVTKFNEEDKIVDIDIQIDSGPLVYIERIDIEGNYSTKDEVIRRELIVFEKEKDSASLRRISEQNVQRLGYFESVEFSTKPGSAHDQMVMVIKVKEQSTGNVQAGAGYGTGGEGLLLRGQISNQNLFGRGQTLSASVNWSNYRRMFDVSFIEPYMAYVFDNPLSFAFTAYNRDIFLGEFNRRSTGGDITFGYPLGGPFAAISRKWKQKASPSLMPYVFDFEALSLLLTYTVERVEIGDSTVAVRNWHLHQGEPLYTTSLRPAIRLDQRDNRIFPSRGYFFEFRTEFASQYLGGMGLAKLENYWRHQGKNNSISSGRKYMTPDAQATNFMKYGTNLRFYHNLDDWFFLKGFVLKANWELGFLNTMGKPLIFENYALGGGNTVRGYSYRSLSPVERAGALFPFDPRRDLRIGGNKQLYGSFELEFPILKILKISGVLFFDYGNVYSHEDNLFYMGGKSANASRVKPLADPLKLYQWLGLYSSAGFGLRWLSPLGYLRFEWGFPLNPRPSGTAGLIEKDPAVQFEFNIGPSF